MTWAVRSASSSLHRIAGTELRVISDLHVDAVPAVRAEEEVIRGYVAGTAWPHRWVTLFLLQDLHALLRHVPEGGGLPPGGAAALDQRPVVAVYDLANPAACHVFVNQQATQHERYWDDLCAMTGLLAHEHAHPLAENNVTRASRRLKVERSWHMQAPLPGGSASRIGGSSAASGDTVRSALRLSAFEASSEIGAEWRSKVERLLALLVDTLCLRAPREIFANEAAIRSGFEEALLHVDRLNVANAIRSVDGREVLRGRLQEEADTGTLPRSAVDLVLLIGDFKAYLDLALEVASFYRAGRGVDARELEAGLQASVFPTLEPEVLRAYQALRDQYIALRSDASCAELVSWSEVVVQILAGALQQKGLVLRYRVRGAA